jgi:antibiotic biosynthesis monooxygenase (ABM) superfamily enzyme
MVKMSMPRYAEVRRMIMQRSVPTSIVSYTVHPDDQAAFGVWINRLLNVVVAAPGYVSAAVHRPDVSHEDQWITIYRFTDRVSLDAWLDSELRMELLAGAEDMIVGDEHIQIVAGERSRAAVRIVSSYCLTPGTDSEHIMARAILDRSLATFPGFVSSETLPPVEGVQRDTVLMLTFDTDEHVRSWIDSPERAIFLEALDPIIEGDLTTNVVGSFGGWFSSTHSDSVKRWKQVVIVLAALVPLSLVVAGLEDWLWPGLARVPAILVADVITIFVLTYLLMPPLTRSASRWLSS